VTRAEREGEAHFTAELVIDGEPVSVHNTMRAWPVDRVEFAPICRQGEPPAVAWIPVSAAVHFTHKLFHGTTALAGYGLTAVTHERLTKIEVGKDGEAVVELAPIHGEFTLSSVLDPDYTQGVFAYDLTDIDSVSFWYDDTKPLFVGKTAYVGLQTTVAGQKPCVWGFPRQLTNETPETCMLGDLPAEIWEDDGVDVEALQVGTCRLRFGLPGTALSATLEIPIYQGFEGVSLPEQLYDQDYLTGLCAVGVDDVLVVGFDIDTGANPYDGWIMRRSGESWLPTERLTGFGWLNAVHGLGPLGPAWVVGTGSAKFDGASWTTVPTGTEARLEAVWVSAADSAWAVAGFALMHWDGVAWSKVETGTNVKLTGVWAPPEGGDPIVIGERATVLRLTAGGPEPVLPADLGIGAFDSPIAIAGASASDLWIVDEDVALHFDGSAWTAPDLGSTVPLRGVWPVGDGFAYLLLYRAGIGGSTGMLSVARYGPTKTTIIPIGEIYAVSEPEPKIVGAGDTVWVKWFHNLVRYRHDPGAVFP
jgi:hypothetical protein